MVSSRSRSLFSHLSSCSGKFPLIDKGCWQYKPSDSLGVSPNLLIELIQLETKSQHGLWMVGFGCILMALYSDPMLLQVAGRGRDLSWSDHCHQMLPSSNKNSIMLQRWPGHDIPSEKQTEEEVICDNVNKYIPVVSFACSRQTTIEIKISGSPP